MQDPKKTISPKVIASAVSGLAVTLILGLLNAVTPETFAFLGSWSSLAYMLVVAVAGVVAGWAKSDPMRRTIDAGIAGAVPAVITTAVNVAAPAVASAVSAAVDAETPVSAAPAPKAAK